MNWTMSQFRRIQIRCEISLKIARIGVWIQICRSTDSSYMKTAELIWKYFIVPSTYLDLFTFFIGLSWFWLHPTKFTTKKKKHFFFSFEIITLFTAIQIVKYWFKFEHRIPKYSRHFHTEERKKKTFRMSKNGLKTGSKWLTAIHEFF